jgi:transposase
MEWTVAIGVDTHKHVHVAVAVDRFGAQLDSREVETSVTGYRALLAWALELGVPAFAVEGWAATASGSSASSSALALRSGSASGRVTRSVAAVRAI